MLISIQFGNLWLQIFGCFFCWFVDMSLSERKTIDLEQGWDFMHRGIMKLKNILEGLPEPQFSPEDYMMLYTYVFIIPDSHIWILLVFFYSFLEIFICVQIWTLSMFHLMTVCFCYCMNCIAGLSIICALKSLLMIILNICMISIRRHLKSISCQLWVTLSFGYHILVGCLSALFNLKLFMMYYMVLSF